jgi:hypothetical protein
MKPFLANVVGNLLGIAVFGAILFLSGFDPERPDPFQAAKLLTVASLAAYLTARAVVSRATIAREMAAVENAASAVAQWTGTASAPKQDSPEGRAVAKARAWGAASPTAESATACAVAAGREWMARIDRHRTFGGSAVYVGLAGTLLGLTISVAGIGHLGAEGDGLRQQILAVIGGFSSSFFCALAGVVATVGVGGRVSRFDAQVERLEDALTDYFMAKLYPALVETRQSLEAHRQRSQSEALATKLSAEIGAVLQKVAADLRTQIDVLGEVARAAKISGELSERTASSVKESADKLAESAQDIADGAGSLVKAAEALAGGATTLEDSVDALTPLKTIAELLSTVVVDLAPLFESSRALSDSLGKIRDFPERAEGIVMKLAGELSANQNESKKLLEGQTEGIAKILEHIKTEIDLLRAAVNDYSTLVRDVPAGAAAERITRELESAVGAVRAEGQAEAQRLNEVRSQTIDVESRVTTLLAQLEQASQAVRKDMQASAEAMRQARAEVDLMQERLDGTILVPRPWGRK